MATKPIITKSKKSAAPVVKSAVAAPAPKAAPVAKDKSLRLMETTPNKLVDALGGDTVILVSKKNITDILAAKSGTDLLAKAGL